MKLHVYVKALNLELLNVLLHSTGCFTKLRAEVPIWKVIERLKGINHERRLWIDDLKQLVGCINPLTGAGSHNSRELGEYYGFLSTAPKLNFMKERIIALWCALMGSVCVENLMTISGVICQVHTCPWGNSSQNSWMLPLEMPNQASLIACFSFFQSFCQRPITHPKLC